MTRVRIKMCGMTRQEDIQHAANLGVDAIGLIFYPKSKRYVSLQEAGLLLKVLPAFMDAVAVMVNPEPEFVHQLLTELPIQYLQFHGNETPGYCAQFNTPYIKAISATSKEEIEKNTLIHSKAVAIVLDTPTVEYGGSGNTFDWQMIPTLPKPLILAGGLNVHNIKGASRYKPYAVDVCSGIEITPGIKDHNKMNEFVHALWGKQ